MSLRPRITIIAGSTRSKSSSLCVATELERIYTVAGASPTLLALRDIPDAALTHREIHNPPAAVTEFLRPALDCDGLLFVTPEYNGGMPGMLKLFIDLLPFPGALMHKPVAMVGVAAGNWGALRPIEHLSAILIYRQAMIYPGHVFIPNCNAALDHAALRVTHADTLARLEKQAQGFIKFVTSLHASGHAPKA
jgi:NAD(P)H-dependent FMN reductase